MTQTITVPGLSYPFIQSYTYDELNRLKSATETYNSSNTWKQTYTFDRYGNRRFDFTSGNTTVPASSCTEAVCNPTISTTNNRLSSSGYNYEASGNTTYDAALRKFTYDAENKQTKAESTNSSQQVTGTLGEYFYDGDGKRVKKIAGDEVTIFVYDAGGKLVAEYSTIVASANDAKVAYLTTDSLGSPRINTDANGAVTARHDYYPFGEEVNTSQRSEVLGYASSGDTVRKKFTGYERDQESSLDFGQARYYSSQVGRFYSVDPENAGSDPDDPQGWNGYSYAGNNPVLFVDPNGEDYVICDKDGKCYGQNTDKEFQNARKAGGLLSRTGKSSTPTIRLPEPTTMSRPARRVVSSAWVSRVSLVPVVFLVELRPELGQGQELEREQERERELGQEQESVGVGVQRAPLCQATRSPAVLLKGKYSMLCGDRRILRRFMLMAQQPYQML